MLLGYLFKKKRKEEKEIQAAYKRLFLSPDGKLVLDHLAYICKLDSVSFHHGLKENEIYFFEGQKRILLHILNMINSSVYNYLMQKSVEINNEE